MTQDQIVELHIEGLRSLADVRLPLQGLSVLIGENGSGKSSIIEACELLRRASTPDFFSHFNNKHGGLTSLLRSGAPRLTLGVKLAGSHDLLSYEFSIAREGGLVIVEREHLEFGWLGRPQQPQRLIQRTRSEAKRFVAKTSKPGQHLIDVEISPDKLMLTAFGSLPPLPEIARMIDVLSRIDVQLPFDTLPEWVIRETRSSSPLRGTIVYQPADTLARFGVNLANAYSALKNISDAHWQETMSLVRLGLGEDLESVNVRPDPGGGAIGLGIKLRDFEQQLPAFSLSEGQLAYLGFVALFRLNLQRASLLAFDEPETHLHPALLMRVLGFFESAAEHRPILLATHSDRLLDGLREPAKAARLLSLDEKRATRVAHPDSAALAQWMERYRGLGAIRSEGFEDSVFVPEEGP